jgi:hypothetical protein
VRLGLPVDLRHNDERVLVADVADRHVLHRQLVRNPEEHGDLVAELRRPLGHIQVGAVVVRHVEE